MRFRLAGVTDSLDGIGLSLTVFFQGCSIRCPGCQNPELQDFSGGYEEDPDIIVTFFKENEDFYSSFVATGGEATEQVEALLCFAQNIRKPKILYTGRKLEELDSRIRDNFDIIVHGPYVEELKTNGFPASSNQKIWCKDNSLLEKFMRNKNANN